ncbi:MAG: CDP-diacylglycerol--serine O-phosphatidyltransferase [Rickettsiales bacterium]|nr:CDP-diacylglycerol--serine O-phosphatidyltransferase [Rickettsiales bacterium]
MSSKTKLPLSRLVPNLITIGALCCGMTSIRYALLGNWELVATFMVLAAFLDGIDGRVARMLKATSDFGAQMDSLSDIVCFGVAPAVVLHLWALHDIKRFGWAIALFYTVCCALRLARFNTSLMEEEKEEWQKHYFTGVPAPMGALLAILPIIISLQFGEDFLQVDKAWLMAAYLPCIAMLMSSRLPTFTLKGYSVPTKWVLPIMLGSVGLILGLIIETWLILSVLGGLYLISLPLSAIRATKVNS